MTTTHKILVGRDHSLGETLDRIAEQLQQRGLKVIRLPPGDGEKHCQIPLQEAEHYLSETQIIVVSSRTRIGAQVMAAAPKLKGIVFPSIGFNSCDIQAATNNGIVVVNGVTAENYESMAEASIMLMSALLLELESKRQALQLNRPNPTASQYTSRMLKGKVVGLIGYGRIAREVIRRLKNWGIQQFLVYTRRPPEFSVQDVQFCSLSYLLAQSHIVSVHCPLNEQTHHLIAGDELKTMREDAVLINTSRGGIIDEEALYQALKKAWIKAAAIDTFEQEPLAAASPLRELENIYLTQHNIGHTRDLFESLVPKAIENVDALLAGKRPEDWVNRH